MKRIIFILAILIYLTSCTCEPVIQKQYIRDTIIRIAPPIIIDSGKPQIITDSIIQYIREKGKDTIIKVQYLPKEKIITVYAKPDTINLFQTDTLMITEFKEVIKENGVTTTLLYIFGIVLVLALIFILLRLFK